MHTQLGSERLKGRALKDLDVDGRIKLKLILTFGGMTERERK
jgi:hypothetical protein